MATKQDQCVGYLKPFCRINYENHIFSLHKSPGSSIACGWRVYAWVEGVGVGGRGVWVCGRVWVYGVYGCEFELGGEGVWVWVEGLGVGGGCVTHLGWVNPDPVQFCVGIGCVWA